MLVGAFGANTPSVRFALGALDTLLSESIGPTVKVDVSTFAAFRETVLSNIRTCMLATGFTPEPKIASLLARSQTKCIIFTEPALSAIAALKHAHGADFMSAVRIHSSHYAAMEPLLEAPATRFVDLGVGDLSVGQLFTSIAEALQIDISNTMVEQMSTAIGAARPEDPLFDLAWISYPSIPDRNPEVEHHPLDAAAIDIGFPPIQHAATLGLQWPARLFSLPGDDAKADQPISLIGKSRTLFFGPFMYLAPGAWRATYHVNVARNQSGNTVLADIQGHLKVLAVGKMPLPKEGSFEFSLDFQVPNIETVIEIRLHTLEGGIHGLIELVALKLTRI